ncbi:YdcF family protein, partial [Thermodesulfobacteriota bacterium]
LGGGHTADENLPVTGQLSYASLVRLVEGIRIHNDLPKSKLILSGSAVYSKISEARAMADVAVSLGLDAKSVILESESRDTKDQARIIKRIIGDDRFILVTSAAHMSRAMALFNSREMNPIPAPIGHIIKSDDELRPGSFFPGAGNIGKIEYLFHEYMGLAWAKFRGQT